MVDTKKLEELLKDKEFCEKLFALDETKDVQDLLNTNGIELSIEEIEQIKDLVIRFQNDDLTDEEKKLIEKFQKTGELSDDDLENVSGGLFLLIGGGAVALTVGLAIYGVVSAYISASGRRW